MYSRYRHEVCLFLDCAFESPHHEQLHGILKVLTWRAVGEISDSEFTTLQGAWKSGIAPRQLLDFNAFALVRASLETTENSVVQRMALLQDELFESHGWEHMVWNLIAPEDNVLIEELGDIGLTWALNDANVEDFRTALPCTGLTQRYFTRICEDVPSRILCLQTLYARVSAAKHAYAEVLREFNLPRTVHWGHCWRDAVNALYPGPETVEKSTLLFRRQPSSTSDKGWLEVKHLATQLQEAWREKLCQVDCTAVLQTSDRQSNNCVARVGDSTPSMPSDALCEEDDMSEPCRSSPNFTSSPLPQMGTRTQEDGLCYSPPIQQEIVSGLGCRKFRPQRRATTHGQCVLAKIQGFAGNTISSSDSFRAFCSKKYIPDKDASDRHPGITQSASGVGGPGYSASQTPPHPMGLAETIHRCDVRAPDIYLQATAQMPTPARNLQGRSSTPLATGQHPRCTSYTDDVGKTHLRVGSCRTSTTPTTCPSSGRTYQRPAQRPGSRTPSSTSSFGTSGHAKNLATCPSPPVACSEVCARDTMRKETHGAAYAARHGASGRDEHPGCRDARINHRTASSVGALLQKYAPFGNPDSREIPCIPFFVRQPGLVRVVSFEDAIRRLRSQLG